MIKYDETVENLDNFTIILVDKKPKKELEINNPQLPVSFLERYIELLKELSVIDIFLKKFSTSQFLDTKWHSDIEYDICEYVSPSPTLLMHLDEAIQDLFKFKKRFCKNFNENLEDLDEYQEIEFLFETKRVNIYRCPNDILEELEKYECIINYLNCISLNFIKKFSNIYEKIKLLINEIKVHKTIIYEINPLQQFKLPNSWYITPYGDLYNTFISEKSSSDPTIDSTNLGVIERLFSDYVVSGHIVKKGENIEEHHKKNLLFLNEKEQQFLDERNEVIRYGYVKSSRLLDFRFRDYQFPILKDDIFINGKDITFDLNVRKIIIGFLGAKAILFKYLRNLDEYTNCNQFEKIYSYCSCNAQNFLVRCLGFHRICYEDRTIITSSVNFEYELKEYIEKGWNIKQIPPIIIDKENKTIYELESSLDKVKIYQNIK